MVENNSFEGIRIGIVLCNYIRGVARIVEQVRTSFEIQHPPFPSPILFPQIVSTDFSIYNFFSYLLRDIRHTRGIMEWQKPRKWHHYRKFWSYMIVKCLFDFCLHFLFVCFVLLFFCSIFNIFLGTQVCTCVLVATLLNIVI